MLSVNGQRLWATIAETAHFGGTVAGGITRLALSDADRAVRDWLMGAARASGFATSVDALGNIFVRRAGDAPLAPIVCGSHLDTQPAGGCFDGILGVLAGLEVLRTLEEAGVRTRHPLELIDWTNEEGTRFAPALTGSAVFCGVMTAEAAYGARDADGVTFAEALAHTGYRGTASRHDLAAYFELHIEQGPVLESEGAVIGAVTGIQGVRWLDVTIVGESAHAGTTPIAVRRDAMLAASHVVQLVRRIALAQTPVAVATVGRLSVTPGSRNSVAGGVALSVDMRHPSDAVLDGMIAALTSDIGDAVHPCTAETTRVSSLSPVQFDPVCVATVAEAAAGRGLRHRAMVSGAFHDAANTARICPTGMIFVPCARGLSHNEAESATQADVTAGANVLLDAILKTDAAL